MTPLPAVRGAPGEDRGVESWLDANATLVTVALVGLNLLLKLPLIRAQGLWFDEAVTLGHLLQPFDLPRTMASDASAPLYGILLYGWSALLGTSLEAARALSALSSSLTAGALFLFGRRFLDARAGLIAAGLFTLSRTQIYFGHEARAYALVGLLCVASFYVFLELIEKPTRLRIGLAALASAALVYAHYVAVFALCAQLLAALCLVDVRSRAMRAYVLSQILAAALFAPCVVLLLLADDPLPMRGWIPPPAPGDVLYVLGAFVGGPLLIGLYAAVLSCAWASARLGSATFDRDRLTVLGLWTIAPLVLDYAFSLLIPSFLYRYLLYSSLGLFLLIGYALTRLPLPDLGRLAVFALLALPAGWGALSDPILRPDWRGAAEIARHEHGEDVLTIVTPSFELVPFAYHYEPSAFSDPTHMAARLRDLGVHALPNLDGVRRPAMGSARRVVVVSATGGAEEEIDARLALAGFEPVRTEDLTGILVRVFEPAPVH